MMIRVFILVYQFDNLSSYELACKKISKVKIVNSLSIGLELFSHPSVLTLKAPRKNASEK